MILTAIFNAVLAVGVIVMVVTSLMWAILTQHGDPGGADSATVRTHRNGEHRHARSPQYKPIVGRA
jgi:ABC-type cobalt transport system substrate-binding protein